MRVFEQDGAYRACLRGYPSHRLGPGRPAHPRSKGTNFAYTMRVQGRTMVGALDLDGGDRWLRLRPAHGRVVHMRLRAAGALIWTTGTGGVFVASDYVRAYRGPDGARVRAHHGAAKVDQLAAPATGLRITRRHTASDICADEFEYTYHWLAAGVPRAASFKELDVYSNCA